jgi:hypothetical protein
MPHKNALVKCEDCIHCSAFNKSDVYGECEKFQMIVHLTELSTCGFYKADETPKDTD